MGASIKIPTSHPPFRCARIPGRYLLDRCHELRPGPEHRRPEIGVIKTLHLLGYLRKVCHRVIETQCGSADLGRDLASQSESRPEHQRFVHDSSKHDSRYRRRFEPDLDITGRKVVDPAMQRVGLAAILARRTY